MKKIIFVLTTLWISFFCLCAGDQPGSVASDVAPNIDLQPVAVATVSTEPALSELDKFLNDLDEQGVDQDKIAAILLAVESLKKQGFADEQIVKNIKLLSSELGLKSREKMLVAFGVVGILALATSVGLIVRYYMKYKKAREILGYFFRAREFFISGDHGVKFPPDHELGEELKNDYAFVGLKFGHFDNVTGWHQEAISDKMSKWMRSLNLTIP